MWKKDLKGMINIHDSIHHESARVNKICNILQHSQHPSGSCVKYIIKALSTYRLLI